MNDDTNAICINICGRTVLSLSYDHIEGFIQVAVLYVVGYMDKHGKITDTTANEWVAGIGLWVHQFLKPTSVGIVTQVMNKIKNVTPAPVTPLAPVA